MELNVCKLAAVAVHALIIGICHAMCAQKIYKFINHRGAPVQNICEGLVALVRGL